MDKIILNDGTKLEFNKSLGLKKITIENKTVEELETLLTVSNLSKVKISNSDESNVYGEYTNLKGVSITKMLTDGSIIISLEETIIT